jgi:hypothetical protein
VLAAVVSARRGASPLLLCERHDRRQVLRWVLSTAIVPEVVKPACIGQSWIAVPNCTAAVPGGRVTLMMPIPQANDARAVKGWLQLQASTIRVNLPRRCRMAAVISRATESALAGTRQR